MHGRVGAHVRKANKQVRPKPVFKGTNPECEAKDILATIFLQKILIPPCCNSWYLNMEEIQMGLFFFGYCGSFVFFFTRIGDYDWDGHGFTMLCQEQNWSVCHGVRGWNHKVPGWGLHVYKCTTRVNLHAVAQNFVNLHWLRICSWYFHPVQVDVTCKWQRTEVLCWQSL